MVALMLLPDRSLQTDDRRGVLFFLSFAFSRTRQVQCLFITLSRLRFQLGTTCWNRVFFFYEEKTVSSAATHNGVQREAFNKFLHRSICSLKSENISLPFGARQGKFVCFAFKHVKSAPSFLLRIFAVMKVAN